MDLTNIAVRAMEQPVQAVREAKGKEPVSDAAPTAAEKEKKAVPLYDEYVPEDKSVKQSAGLYRIAHGEDGSPRIEFDRPETAENPEVDAPADAAEETTINTDAVDREIKALEKKQEQLEKRLASAAGPAETESLEKQLAQVESELRQKDSDSYRRQHATVS